MKIEPADAAAFAEMKAWRYESPYDFYNGDEDPVRAVNVYERAGFVETGRHIRTFERWGDVEFVEMDEQG